MYFDNMKIARKEKLWTQEEIAYRMGMSQAQYQKYETGKHEMPTKYFRKFCVVTGESADKLLELNATK